MKKNLLLALGLSVLIIASCKKKDPGPTENPAVACASPDMDSATVNETITFTNCSKNSTTYNWDFGDGNTSVQKNPTHKYTAKGTYTVKVKAHSEFATSTDEQTMTIFIGDRYISAIRLNQMPFKNQAGSDWDSDGTGPDVFVGFFPTVNQTGKGSEVRENVTQSMLPLFWNSYQQVLYDEKATNEEWTLIVADSEGGGTPENMTVFTFNPTTASPKLTAAGWDLDVIYRHKP